MKILITGAKGMLGQYIKTVFERDNDIIAYDKEELDITDEKEVNEKIKELMPDLIINCAVFANVDESEKEDKYKLALDINATAVKYLARAANNVDVPIIHFSSDYIFDGMNEQGYDEDDSTDRSVNRYGETKLMGESEIQTNTDKYYIIRLTRLFGKQGSAENVKKSFVDLMLDLAKEKNEIDVVNEELSNPTYAKDLAERVKYIVDNNLNYGIYHITNSGSCTWYEFAVEIFKIKKIDIKVNPVPALKFPRPAKRPRYSILINTKLPPFRHWREALKEYLISVK